MTLDEEGLRRSLAKHIHTRSLPHDANVFFNDLLHGGVFTQNAVAGTVTWSHPVIKQFFWVKNLLGKQKFHLIQKTLSERPEVTMAAIVGSQLRNAGEMVDSSRAS